VSKPSHTYLSAHAWMQAMDTGQVSARDVLELHLARVNAVNPSLNAVVALDLAGARQRADDADRARQRGERWGPLHGLPMTIKDTWEVPGMPCTAGAPRFKDHRPPAAAHAVQRLLDAGAIVFGKTNVPYLALDIQSFNEVYGTSRNPWDLSRTPGGSSGGAAAALAAGMTPLELGSDIGGSIRIPAHFCGVYGHKSTYGIVPLSGHIPGDPGMRSDVPLGVAGPLSRSADDLQLMLDLIAGPTRSHQTGWQLALPPARHDTLSTMRVLMWVDDPDCPIDADMATTYRALGRQLEAAGAQVSWGSPQGMRLNGLDPCYTAQMGCMMAALLTPAERRQLGMVTPFGAATAPIMKRLGKLISLPQHVDRFVAGLGMGHKGWLELVEEGLHLQHAFLGAFQSHDVILAPPTLGTAFPHDHGLFPTRKLTVNGHSRHYSDQFMWIAPATLLGLPATSAPVGRTPQGLPVNVQVIGAPFEDRTTIRFAQLLEGLGLGFTPPPL
jgi:amidase